MRVNCNFSEPTQRVPVTDIMEPALKTNDVWGKVLTLSFFFCKGLIHSLQFDIFFSCAKITYIQTLVCHCTPASNKVCGRRKTDRSQKVLWKEWVIRLSGLPLFFSPPSSAIPFVAFPSPTQFCTIPPLPSENSSALLPPIEIGISPPPLVLYQQQQPAATDFGNFISPPPFHFLLPSLSPPGLANGCFCFALRFPSPSFLLPPSSIQLSKAYRHSIIGRVEAVLKGSFSAVRTCV